MSRASRITAVLCGIILILGGLAALLILNPTAREVTLDSLGLAFAFFTTPFILETLFAAIFLFGLLAYNRWRLHKEGDGWVWLMTQEPDEKNLPAAITQRLQSTVLAGKPEAMDEAKAEAGVIEGFLELGMAAQALQELRAGFPETASPPSLDVSILRIRVLAANLDNDEAKRRVQTTLASDPESRSELAAACLESARWLLRHMHREDLAREWLAEGRTLDAGATAKLSAHDPLRALL